MTSHSLHRQPLHQQIAARLHDQILRHAKPGLRLEAESRLAKRFKVAVHTVREALSALAQKGLVERRHGSGTYVAHRDVRQHIALWLVGGNYHPQSSYWPARVSEQLHALLRSRGLRVKTYSVHFPIAGPTADVAHEEFLEDISCRRISAIGIVHGPVDSKTTRIIRDHRIPVVGNVVARASRSFAVGEDQLALVRAGAERLAKMGARRIAFMGWLPPGVDSAQIHGVFKSSVTRHGATTRDGWVRGDLHPALPGAGYEEFREIWTVEREKPDGLLVTDDVLFQDVVTAILELGIAVPERLKVVAHANKGAVTCPFFPAARMESDPDAHAQAAAELLIKLARREPVSPRTVELPFRWVECAANRPPQTYPSPTRMGREDKDRVATP
ncbi:MAG: substrate-binding domain-containing protein [Verrucomicrobia bacterium]|nr:substrate-binding domain-containing protein [Verrucomicrobiota bacterium]